MAILPIYTYDSPILREKTLEVAKPAEEILKLVMDMMETMEIANGVGLAANQVGAGHSIFIVDVTDIEGETQEKPLIAINPIITDLWGDEVPHEEGCLSIPNIHEEIIRPEKILLKYGDLNFE